MKTWVRKSLSVGILSAAALLFAPGAAHADAPQATTGTAVSADNTAPAGIDVYSPITIPVSICGTSLANLGGATTTASCDTSVAGRTESTKTTARRVSPAIAPVTESATGGHGNGGDFCGNSLHFLGGGPSFHRCGQGFRGHRGHWHGGAFLGDSSFGGFDDVAFYGDDLDGDDLYPGDFDDSYGDDLSLGDQDDQDVMPTKPIKGNGSNDGYGNAAPTKGNGNVAPTTAPDDGYGNAAPTKGNGNVAPTTAPDDGYGNAAPTKGNGNVSPTTGDVMPTTGDVTPTTGDVMPTTGDVMPTTGAVMPTTGDNAGYGGVSPTKPAKHTKPAVKPAKHTKPAVKPIKGNGDTTGYGAVSPATGSDTTTDGGRHTATESVRAGH